MKSKMLSQGTMRNTVKIILVLILLSVVGCRNPNRYGNGGQSANPNIPGPVLSPDVLHSGDLIRVSFSDVPNPPGSVEIRIREDGSILLPYDISVQADGKTVSQLQEAIRQAYVPKLFQRLTVIVHSEQRFYTVSGQVRMPGPRPYLGETTVLSAIAAAGDFTDFAQRRRVKVTRANSGQEFIVDCIDAQRDQSKDPSIYPGDYINVPRRYW